MESTSIRLLGASDDHGRVHAKGKQYMQIDLDQDVLEELLTCSRRGKAPQVILGRNSVLRYGDHTHVLETRETTFRQELYKASRIGGDKENDWDFAGLVGHVMTLRRAEQASKEMEIALEALKHNMKSITQEMEATKTLITPNLPTVKGSKNNKAAQNLYFRNIQSSKTPTLDSKTATGKSTLSPNMTNTFTAGVKEIEAAKFSLTHLLAIKPLTLEECCTKLNGRKAIVSNALSRIADREDGTFLYRLRKMRYKDLDVWKFPYPSEEDRKTAIENAIHAFDALRIEPQDKLWQGLLRPSERGRGITLSKLKLNSSGSTPLMKSSVLNGKTGLPKKSDSKKPEKTKSEKLVEKTPKLEKSEKSEKILDKSEKEVKKNLSNSTPRTPVPAKEKNREQSSSKHDDSARTPVPKSKSKLSKDKLIKEERFIKEERPVKEERVIKEERSTKEDRGSKEERPSTASKALLNKPKNPSPLGGSPPINASELEQNHPVHKALARNPSPIKSDKSLKRKSDQHDDAHREEKKKKLKVESNAPTPRALPASNPSKHAPKPTPKRKIEDDSSSSSEDTPLALKIRKLKNGESVRSVSHSMVNQVGKNTPHKSKAINGTNGRRKDSGSSGSDNSPALSMSWRQNIELGAKFRKYYAKYEKLYKEIERSAEPPSEEKKEEVMKMHKMLKDIKEKLAAVR